MNVNKYLKLVSLGVLMISTNSCSKFLDLKPDSLITTDNAYSTAANIEAALNGAYSSFISTNYYQWEVVMHSDVRSDNAYSGGSGDPDFLQLDLNRISNTNGAVQRDWEELYASIAKCNNVINNIDQVVDPKLTAERRKQIIGEASFLRAFHYYHLVKLFGAVPIEKNSNSADPDVIRIPRSSEIEVYDFIASDLEVAITNLPDVFSEPSVDKVRASKGAANALMAKIWAQRSDRDYNKVLKYCNAVINSPAGYALLSNYADLFDGNHNYNSESIMEIPFLGNTAQGSWGVEMSYPTHDENGEIPDTEWQRYTVPSKSLVAAYDAAGDVVRKSVNISFEIAPWADENWNPCGDGMIAIPFNVKQKHPNNWNSGDHFYLLRLADIILLKAEAQNMVASPSEAATTVNLLRSTRGLGNVVAISKDQMKTVILNERQLELAFEAQRWDDLNRFGVTTQVMNNLNEVKYTCNGGTQSSAIAINYNMSLEKTVLPIPLKEIQANPKLVQNSGY